MESINRKITTSEIDTSLGVAACKAYEERDYRRAEKLLIEILDLEPNNWLARYYLAVCYAKNKQKFAAQRAFRVLYDKCTDQDIRSKACLMLQRISAEIMESGNRGAAEFGRFNEAPSRSIVNKGW